MINSKMSPKQLRDIQSTREMGIEIDQFGFSEEYDLVFAPFMKLAGLIGQYEKALHTYKDSPYVSHWISEQKCLEKEFAANYRALFLDPKKSVQYLPQQWIVDFYSNLNNRK